MSLTTIAPIDILLLEPDQSIGALLKDFLEVNKHEVVLCSTVAAAGEQLRTANFDAFILEADFPQESAFHLVQDLRERDPWLPVLFVSNLGEQSDIIRGLRAGADDYILKPFDVEELMLRLKAVLRRTIREIQEVVLPTDFVIGNYHFDAQRQELSLKGQEPVRLTTKESELLRQLAVRKNEILTRERALRLVWSEFNYANARSMDVYITKLRKLLKGDPNVEIVNIRGQGFKLVV